MRPVMVFLKAILPLMLGGILHQRQAMGMHQEI